MRMLCGKGRVVIGLDNVMDNGAMGGGAGSCMAVSG